MAAGEPDGGADQMERVIAAARVIYDTLEEGVPTQEEILALKSALDAYDASPPLPEPFDRAKVGNV